MFIMPGHGIRISEIFPAPFCLEPSLYFVWNPHYIWCHKADKLNIYCNAGLKAKQLKNQMNLFFEKS